MTDQRPLWRSPQRLSAPWESWVLGLVALSLSMGCDDDPPSSSSKYELSFESPADGDSLGCSDDQDRSTPRLLERDVTLKVVAPEDERRDLIIELRAEGASWSPQRRGLGLGDSVTFADLPFEQGSYELSAALLNLDEERDEALASLNVELDEADPLCAVASTELSFLSPVSGETLSGADDLDGDLTNGLQIPVEVEVVGPVVSELVEVQVNGAPQRAVALSNGVARFEQVTIPIPSEGLVEARISAVVQGSSGLVEGEITVNVEAATCALSLTPEAVEGCDLSSVDDQDPSDPGVQTTLRAQTDCAQVTWVVNGVSYAPAEVVDGEAAINVTLNEGVNTISATARSASGLAGSAPVYTLDVNSVRPEVALEGVSELGEVRLGLDSAVEQLSEGPNGVARWRLSGFSAQLEPESVVTLTAEPSIEGLPEQVTVDEGGRFSLEIEASYLCGVTLTPSVMDPCGGVHQGASYTLCLDATRPLLSLSSPSGDDLILAQQDLDEERPGVQVELPVELLDPRADVDYAIEVACRAESTSDELMMISDAPLLKSELRPSLDDPSRSAGLIAVSFPNLESYDCFLVANTGPNTPSTPSIRLRVFEVAPIFYLIDPANLGDAAVCANDGLRIGGLATDIDPDDISLSFTLTSQSGELVRQGSLSALGNDYYGTQVGLGMNGLTDGLYTLNVTGESGGVVMSVRPSSATVQVSTSAPSVGVSSPLVGALDLALDEDGDLDNCVQAPVTLALTDLGARELCYAINNELPRCLSLSQEQLEGGLVELPALNFQEGLNRLNVSLNSCSVPSDEEQFTAQFEYTVTGCEPALKLTRPRDGAWVSLDSGDASERPGYQLAVTVNGLGGEEVFIDAFSEDDQLLTSSELITLNEQGIGTAEITLPQTATERSLRLSPRSERSGLVTEIYQYLGELSFELFAPQGDELCVNQSVNDGSILPGFQTTLIGTGSGLSAGFAPTLSLSCETASGLVRRELRGELLNLGERSAQVIFPSVTFEDGPCEASAEARLLSGELVTSELSFIVDRQAPTARQVSPLPGQVLRLDQDSDLVRPGLQYPVSLEVCGARGQTVSLETSPAQEGGAVERTLELEGPECQVLDFGALTLSGAAQAMTLTATDGCGNSSSLSYQLDADTTVILAVASPQEGELISVAQDLSAEQPGCQIELSATSTGFPSLEGLELEVCSSAEGEGSPLCGNDAKVSAGGCRALDAQGRDLLCSLSLGTGEHSLRVVSRVDGALVSSEAIGVLADCEAPEVLSLSVAQDLNADGCLNRLERGNASSPSASAAFTVRYETRGLNPGTLVSLRALPGELTLAQQSSTGDVGSFEGVTLAPGTVTLYLSARDASGNPLALPGSEGFTGLPLRVDTAAPAPTLLNPDLSQCLNSELDLNEASPGLQLSPVVLTGGDGLDPITLSLIVDGLQEQQLTTSSLDVTMDTLQLNQGSHEVALTARDSCGNVGSIAGFAIEQGLPVWSAPLSVPVEVDVLAPSIQLQGISSGLTLVEGDDANQDSSDGFQVDLSVLISGLEPGNEVSLYSGDARLSTSPATITVSSSAPQLIPVRVTLPPGLHALSARASDSCANASESAPIGLTVDISGCSSQLLGLAANQAIGPNLGQVVDGAVELDLSGSVDLFNPSCAQASVELLSGAVTIASSAVGVDGAVSFSGLRLNPGPQTLRLKVISAEGTTESLGRSVRVDATAPTLALNSPAAGPDGVSVVTSDEDPSSPSTQQSTFELTSAEAAVYTSRFASLSLAGQLVRAEQAVPSSPNALIRFTGVTLPVGESPFEICVSDEAGNESCLSGVVNADPGVPGAAVGSVTVSNPRAPNVSLNITAPAEDGQSGGQVSRYQLRWSLNPIADGDEDAWAVATQLPAVDASVAPGAQELINLDGRLPINERSYVAIRAEDEIGQLGPVRSLTVDARLPRLSLSLPSQGAAWDVTGELFNTTSGLDAIGDFNGDGFDDALASIGQLNGAYASAVIYGAADASSVELHPLSFSAGLAFQASAASAIGDVNGDGAPDLAILSYLDDFSGAQVSLYFGCPSSAPCPPDDAALTTPVASITANGVFRSSVSGGGDLNGDGFDDIVIGGDSSPSSPNYLSLIMGRSSWPATIESTVSDVAGGVYNVYSFGHQNVGPYSQIVPDLDDDGLDELIFSAGGGLDTTFLMYGAELSFSSFGDVIYNGASPDFIELSNPCETLPNGGTAAAFGTYVRGGDVNGDGRGDLLIGNRLNKQMIVMGAALERLDCFTRSEDQFGVIFDLVGDFNGDGHSDLIATHSDDVSTRAYVFMNDGFGAFGESAAESQRTPSVRLLEPAARKIAVSAAGDLVADGRDDLIYMTWGANDSPELSVLY